MQIRPIRETDLNGVREVATTAWLHTYRGILSERAIQAFLAQAYSLDSLRASWKADCHRPQRQFDVVADKDRIIGYGELMEREPTVYELTRIYLLPDVQGNGIGKCLLQQLIDAVSPLRSLFAWVEKENLGGRAFYHSMHFHAEEEIADPFFGTITHLVKYVRGGRTGNHRQTSKALNLSGEFYDNEQGESGRGPEEAVCPRDYRSL